MALKSEEHIMPTPDQINVEVRHLNHLELASSK